MTAEIEEFNQKAIERIKRLTDFALYANEHFKALKDTQNFYLQHRKVYDMASFYFQTTVFSHNTYIFLALSKMFCDQNRETESSRSLLQKIVHRNDEMYKHPFDVVEFESSFSDEFHTLHFESPKEAMDVINEELDNWQTKLDKIKTLRDKYYAHMDRKQAENYTKLFEDNAITMDDIDQLLNLNFTICNCLNSLLRNTTVHHNVMKAGSLDILAKYAQMGKETEEKEREIAIHRLLNSTND